MPKVERFEADWYLLPVDISALPVAAANLEAIPREANDAAIFEAMTEGDKQAIDASKRIDIHWLVHDEPHRRSAA